MHCNVLIPRHVWPDGCLRGVRCDPSPANSFPAAWFGKADVNTDVVRISEMAAVIIISVLLCMISNYSH